MDKKWLLSLLSRSVAVLMPGPHSPPWKAEYRRDLHICALARSHGGFFHFSLNPVPFLSGLGGHWEAITIFGFWIASKRFPFLSSSGYVKCIYKFSVKLRFCCIAVWHGRRMACVLNCPQTCVVGVYTETAFWRACRSGIIFCRGAISQEVWREPFPEVPSTSQPLWQWMWIKTCQMSHFQGLCSGH